MSLKIKETRIKDFIVIKLSGQIVGDYLNTLSKKLETLAGGKYSLVVIDLGETNYIDSHGLGIFVFTLKSMEANNKRLVFLNPQGLIRDIFWETNLNKIFPIINSLEEI